MANQVIRMQQIRAILQLLEKGYSLRAISTQLGIARQAVTLYVNSGHVDPLFWDVDPPAQQAIKVRA